MEYLSDLQDQGEWENGDFHKSKPKKAIWFQKAKETEGILDVSSEQVKLQATLLFS
ncbi:hypothetical protein [Peribacillus sp. YIM B13482]|uniref:hypothetical protein n=1 Tax=Peribacillus sp. YIM B13482 TaxID=3366298 RepID=UPI0036711BBB